MSGTHLLTAHLLYGAGMRWMECVRLRVKDVDFECAEIGVRDGKGQKDRVTMLPVACEAALKRHLRSVKLLHQNELRQGYGAVYLPFALARNIPPRPVIGRGNTCSRRSSFRLIRARDSDDDTTSTKKTFSARRRKQCAGPD